jgi:hypothetical protein
MTKTAKAAKGKQAPAKKFLEVRTEDADIGGQIYAIAPLSAGEMRRAVLPLLQRADGADPMETLGEMLDICRLSLQRASADPVADDWEDRLTLPQAAELFRHVLRVSAAPRA